MPSDDDITGNYNYSIAKFVFVDQITKSLLIEKRNIEKFKNEIYNPSKAKIDKIISDGYESNLDFETTLENINNNLETYLPTLENPVDGSTNYFVESLKKLINDNDTNNLNILLTHYLGTDTSGLTSLPNSFYTSASGSIILGSINNVIKDGGNEFLIGGLIFGIKYNIGLYGILQSLINISHLGNAININFSDVVNVEELNNELTEIKNLLENMFLSMAGILDVDSFLQDFEVFSVNDINKIKLAMITIQVLMNNLTSSLTSLVPNLNFLLLGNNLNSNNKLSELGSISVPEDETTFIENNNNILSEISAAINEEFGDI